MEGGVRNDRGVSRYSVVGGGMEEWEGRGQPTFDRNHVSGRLESLTDRHVVARPERERAHAALVVRGVVAAPRPGVGGG